MVRSIVWRCFWLIGARWHYNWRKGQLVRPSPTRDGKPKRQGSVRCPYETWMWIRLPVLAAVWITLKSSDIAVAWPCLYPKPVRLRPGSTDRRISCSCRCVPLPRYWSLVDTAFQYPQKSDWVTECFHPVLPVLKFHSPVRKYRPLFWIISRYSFCLAVKGP